MAIKEFKNDFAVFGMPKEILSENGPSFNGEQYRKFLVSNDIKCILTPLLHPRYNLAIKNQVDKVKRTLLKLLYGEKYSCRKYSL